MSLSILALDLASLVGYAHSNGKSGVQDFYYRRGDSPGVRWIQLKSWLSEFLNDNPTTLIVYEQVGTHRSRAAAHVAHGMIACVEEVAASKLIELTSRSSQTIKCHALPGVSKRALKNKARMVQAAENRWDGTLIIDDNHADALWLLDLVEHEFSSLQ